MPTTPKKKKSPKRSSGRMKWSSRSGAKKVKKRKSKPATSKKANEVARHKAKEEGETCELSDLDPDSLGRCCVFLADPSQVAVLSVLSRRMRHAVEAAQPWQDLCRLMLRCENDADDVLPRPLAPTSAAGTEVTLCASWKDCCVRWLSVARRVGPGGASAPSLWGATYLRVLHMWKGLEDYYDQHLPGVRASLNPPISRTTMVHQLVSGACGPEQRNESIREILYVYSIHNGQKSGSPDRLMMTNGMFGGYLVYTHFINLRLCPLEVHAPFCVAVTLQKNKFVVLDLPNKALSIQQAQLSQGIPAISDRLAAEHLPSVASLYRANGECTGSVTARSRERRRPKLRGKGFLAWLELFEERLRNGVFQVKPLEGPEFVTVSLFPQVPGRDGCTRAVTKGIEVVSSSVLMPERGAMWAYSIRVRMLTPGETGYMSAEERGFETCQLVSRHWVITSAGEGEGEGGSAQRTEHVRGRGVIGLFPLLEEGAYTLFKETGLGMVQLRPRELGEFRYQSCSGRVEGGAGSFGGELVFVPGSLAEPAGLEFDVQVAMFPLVIPDVIF